MFVQQQIEQLARELEIRNYSKKTSVAYVHAIEAFAHT